MSDLQGSAELAPSSLTRGQLLGVFAAACALSVGLGMVSWGGVIIYPFRLFATWAHEMGHGLAALVTGNRFVELELYQSLGGQALIGGADGASQVFVSSMGLVGPALVGALVMIFGSRVSTAPSVLAALSVAVILSALLWIRNGFGFAAMLLIGIVLALVAKFAPATIRILLAQLLAVQLALSSWSSRDYLFIKEFERDGNTLSSDTQKIAEEWFLPYWFWGGLLGGVSLLLLVGAFWYAWLRPLTTGSDAKGATL